MRNDLSDIYDMLSYHCVFPLFCKCIHVAIVPPYKHTLPTPHRTHQYAPNTSHTHPTPHHNSDTCRGLHIITLLYASTSTCIKGFQNITHQVKYTTLYSGVLNVLNMLIIIYKELFANFYTVPYICQLLTIKDFFNMS